MSSRCLLIAMNQLFEAINKYKCPIRYPKKKENPLASSSGPWYDYTARANIPVGSVTARWHATHGPLSPTFTPVIGER